MKRTPIDELVQAVTSANVEREQLFMLIRDYRQLLELHDTGSLDSDADYRDAHQSVRLRTRELLGENHESLR